MSLVPTGAQPDAEPDAETGAQPGPDNAARRRRPAVGVALWLLWAAFAAWAVARLTGPTVFGAVQLLAYTPYAAAVSVPALAVTLLSRRWRTAVVGTVATTALVTCVAPRALADDYGPPTTGGPYLRVMTVNMLIGGADPAAIVNLVRDNRVELLAVQELTTQGQRALDDAGLADLLPHRVSYLEPAVTGIFSRFRLDDGGVRILRSDFGQATATLRVPGAAPVAVESVHTCAPIDATAGEYWAADLADQTPATVDGPARLLLGDFNATLDHAPLRRLIATGYRDAADVTGAGLSPTWPYDDSWPYGDRRLPGVTIDHVLADRRIGIAAYRVYPVPGSDHRAVYAELALPAGS
jgi:endonuclease/exonuclease/phosphatase (EEP) superfamily protein YafD